MTNECDHEHPGQPLKRTYSEGQQVKLCLYGNVDFGAVKCCEWCDAQKLQD